MRARGPIVLVCVHPSLINVPPTWAGSTGAWRRSPPDRPMPVYRMREPDGMIHVVSGHQLHMVNPVRIGQSQEGATMRTWRLTMLLLAVALVVPAMITLAVPARTALAQEATCA